MTSSLYLGSKRTVAEHLLLTATEGQARIEHEISMHLITDAETAEALAALNTIETLANRWTAEVKAAEDVSFLTVLKSSTSEYNIGKAWDFADSAIKAENPEADTRFTHGPIERLVALVIESMTTYITTDPSNVRYVAEMGVSEVGYELDGDPVWGEAFRAIERLIPNSFATFDILQRAVGEAFDEANRAAGAEAAEWTDSPAPREVEVVGEPPF